MSDFQSGSSLQQLVAEIKSPSLASDFSERPDSSEYCVARASLNDAANDLLLLVNGPRAHFRSLFCYHHDLAAFQIAFDHDFFNKVPLQGAISAAQLAQRVNFDQDRVERIIRFLSTHRVFTETERGTFMHTPYSAIFAKDPEIFAAAHYQLDEFFKAAAEASEATRSFPYQSDHLHSAFTKRFGVPLFQYYSQNPPLAARFGRALKGVAKLDRQVHELKDGYAWENFRGGKIVDIGGASGHASIWLARIYPHLEFIVQDGSDNLLAQGKAQNLDDLDGRVQFMSHDFFDPQPDLDAGAYFIRQVVHNWNDADCIRILRNIVPALKKCGTGTPLLINEMVLPESGEKSRYEEHMMRQVDMLVMVSLGSKQRTLRDFQLLLHEADSRLQIVRVYGEGSMALLEVHLVEEE
ncbi:hypothetical protein ACN47E_001551 [Coniothyrium glycines]